MASTRPRSPARRKGSPSIRTARASTKRSATWVNWDLIPANAIDTTTIIAANPIFGLNALGGAVNVTMKNGFTWQGAEADLTGGSFLRAQEAIQYGKQVGDWSVYMAANQINDGGWRVAGASQLTNFYGDVGYKANGFESHLQLTAGNTQFGASATTPIQQLQTNWGSVYTIPQTTYNQMAMLQWTGAYAYSNTLSFQGGAYFRQFNQQHVDGNGTDVTPCPPYSSDGDQHGADEYRQRPPLRPASLRIAAAPSKRTIRPKMM